jgi:WD repeat-containing protein 23
MYTEYEPEEVEISIEDNQILLNGNPAASEPQYTVFTILHIIILILQFTALQQRQYLLRFLRHLTANGDLQIINDDDNDVGSRWMRSRRRTNPPDPDRFPKVPSEKGIDLMRSGIFGANDTHRNRGAVSGRVDKKKRLARRILDRELAREDYIRRKENQRLMAQVCRICCYGRLLADISRTWYQHQHLI